MKLTTFLMIIGCLQLHAAVFSQTINLTERNVSLKSVISKIEKQSGYTFFTKAELIRSMPNVSVNFKNATLTEALDQLLGKFPLSYSIVEKTVVINLKPRIGIVYNTERVASVLVVGTVLDEQGEPMPAVNIRVKNTESRTTSDKDGKFSILLADADVTLQFSYIGYISQEIKVSHIQSPFVIRLKVANSDLDQVQIMAYSTTTKRLNTGNSYTITSAEIEKNPVPNVLQVLQNRVPGLSITQNTGQVGGSFLVRVRGLNGLNNIDPLYIVDGVPFPAGGLNNNPQGLSGGLPTLNNNRGTGKLGQLGGNALNYINPADIESINVLKDADATSIYGSRGAYGVILITTKKGKQGKPKLSVNVNRALTEPGSYPKLLKTEDYLMLRREAIANDGLQVSATDLDLNGTYPLDAYTDWGRELTGHAANTTRLNTTYSGGTEQTTFSISGSYNDQGNVMKAKGYNRDGSLRFQINNTTPNKKFSIDLSGYYSSTVNTMVPYDFTGDASIFRAPNAPSYFLPDGSLDWASGSNPYAYTNTIYKGVTNNLLGSTSLSYRPVKGLTLKAIVGYNVLSGNELRAIPTTVFNPANVNNPQNTNSSSNAYSIRTLSFEPFANYVTKIAKGTLNLTAGATIQDKMNTQTTLTGTGFVADARLNNPSAGTTLAQSYNQFVFRYAGYFGSLNYNWENKYLMTLTTRYDGSTRFGPGSRYGLFGSAGLGYVFTEEKWIKENLSFLSFGKLRGSYGTSGGDGIPNYQYLSTYSTGLAYLGNTSFVNSGLANSDLHWEQTDKRDIGIVLGFFKDRFTIDAGYYKNTTTSSLTTQPLSNVTGYAFITQNSPAKTQSTGVELALTSTNIAGKDFNWSTNVIMTVPDTKLVSFPDGQILNNPNYIIGRPLTNFKVYNYVGVDPATGLYNYINAAGVKGPFVTSGLLLEADKVSNVNIATKYFGSISNTLSYKSLTVDFTMSIVNKIGYNYQGRVSAIPGGLNQNSTEWALKRWNAPGQTTEVPKVTTKFVDSFIGQNTFKNSSGAYERIVFARLQNVSIAYDLSNSFFKRINVNNLRVVLSGQNLLTFSKYKDLDPENNDLNAMPPLRVFNLGLNFSL